MMEIPKIELPWVKISEMSMNSRLHWAKKHRKVQKLKYDTKIIAMEAGWHKITIPDGRILYLEIIYHPPSGTTCPDDDNVIASYKYSRDVLADVLNVNDNIIRVSARPGSEICKKGKVVVLANLRPENDIITGDRRNDIINRIKSNITINNNSGCWEWNGSHSGNGRGGGYGRISINGRTSSVYRVVATHYFGYIPPGITVDHTCNNRICCNPDHLGVVTNLVNQRIKFQRIKDIQGE